MPVHTDEVKAPRPARVYIAAILLGYGALGVAIHLRLLPLLFSGLAAWAGLPAASDSAARWGLLGPLEAHFGALPWLPWLAWLVGVALLFRRARFALPTNLQDRLSNAGRTPAWIAWPALGALLLLAGYLRMAELWPQGYGLSQFPYDDEGVYAGASQLFVQGILPYRDYFFAHPPIAAISYAPAMLYHFTEWGSPTSFMLARYLSVGYSLVTLALLFFLGRRLAGLWGGVLAGALWALDGRVVEINRKVMLDGPMVLLSCAALLAYLWVRPLLAGDTGPAQPKRPILTLVLVGALGTLSALTKIAGAACLAAIVVDMALLYIDNRRLGTALVRLAPPLGALAGGAAVAVLAGLAPFLVAAPSALTRDVLFFQLLRPSDGLIDVPSRIADITATLGNPLTAIFAALGFITLTLWAWKGSPLGGLDRSMLVSGWRVVILWGLLSLLLFTYSRSFYSHYYIQLAAPLCLLGAEAVLLPDIVRALLSRPYRPAQGWVSWIVVGAMLLFTAPLLLVQVRGVLSRHEDRIFEIVGRYVSDAVPPGAQVLTTDEQFNFLAARPPSRSGTGYLIDSYGHMLALGLNLPGRDWGDLISAGLRGTHGNDAYAVLQSAAAQADFLDRAARAPLVVIHQKGFPRLTPATLQALVAGSTVAEEQPRYTIYRVAKK